MGTGALEGQGRCPGNAHWGYVDSEQSVDGG